ncbi:hydroxyproline-rich glycoprotein family protein [Perilla frutescens var. hirtella]|uniref:Hydroxyproline-rich glycoprotein family protein n=1 Tax=Perilla frutescens var. hirtella TaxID=608512 RepID=A0AAD4JJZ1_PERFH|nr:hydroxyproline-rich glycoprotein family protein [Perilla frutescens var. hirtella]
MASMQNRFLQPQHQQPPAPRRKRWAGCWGGLSFFGKQKGGGKRIVPASRIPETNAISNQLNGSQTGGLPNQATGIALSLLAPPSSPASFSNSALPSTAQSPNCFLSASSPGGPSSTMFVTGPYAHETQLVSPPVFSTFTTEPSTAPLTPPPELAHLTTPSSPDVPYAHFLSSSAKFRTSGKTYPAANDLQATYLLYPGSPASTLRSPVSRTSGDCLSSSFNEREFPPQWDPSIPSVESPYAKSDSGMFPGAQAAGASKSRQDSNFFCPETFAQFYLDHSSFSNSGGRLSISKESDAYSNGGNGYQNRQNKTCKPDAEELEAYRASFGFSADEIITTTNYVEISDVLDDSFSITPSASNRPFEEEHISTPLGKEAAETVMREDHFPCPQLSKVRLNRSSSLHSGVPVSYNRGEDQVPLRRLGDTARSFHNNHSLSDASNIFSKMGASRNGRKYQFGSSNSDAEIEFRRGSSMREGRYRRVS